MEKIEILEKISKISDKETRLLYLSKFITEEMAFEEEDLECDEWIKNNLYEDSKEMLNILYFSTESHERFFSKYDTVDFNAL